MKHYSDRETDSARPKVGETIRYRGTPHGVVSHTDGDLCWVKYYDGQCQPFIWRFKDGLNNLHHWNSKPEGMDAP